MISALFSAILDVAATHGPCSHNPLTDTGIQTEIHLHILPDPSVAPCPFGPTYLETEPNLTPLGQSSQAVPNSLNP